MRFPGKVAVVTGGSSGIGLETATAFAREGARVALVSRGAEAGNAALQKLRTAGCTALFVPTDVSRAEDVRAMATRVAQEWGRLDILINNAGIYRRGSAGDTSLEDWERVLAVNLTGAFLCTQYALPVMRQNGGGVIVNVASEAGLVGFRNQVAYNVSKAGMIALTRSCAVDLAGLGIRVNCVCPGTTDTPLVQAARKRYPQPATARRQVQQVRPLNRLGLPSEIASAILYLASDEAGFATGAILSIDGGYTAQ
jgi:NAD(P)-dependent dehydrogenase (short-subunit alcohol dehydrogenase family)